MLTVRECLRSERMADMSHIYTIIGISPETGESVHIMDPVNLIPIINSLFGNRSVVFKEGDCLDNETIPEMFRESFQSIFYSEYQLNNNWYMYKALNTPYNPLNNYDSTETRMLSTVHNRLLSSVKFENNMGSSKKTGTDTVDTKESGNTEIRGVVSGITHNRNFTLNDLTNKLQKAGWNAPNDYTPVETTTNDGNVTVTDDGNTGEKNTTTNNYNGGKQDTSTYNNTVSTQDSNKAYGGEDEQYKHHEKETITKAGNIGVTTNQQMIQSEIDLRTKNWIVDMLTKWINSITYYDVGVCHCGYRYWY